MLPWLNAPMLYFALCALLGFVALGCELHGHSRGVDDTRAEYMAQVIEATAEARKFEQRRATLIQESDDEKAAELRRVSTQLASALDGLRKRPSRDSVPVAGTAPGSCGTGATLFAEDAAFLFREAARADDLRAELGACQERERAGQ